MKFLEKKNNDDTRHFFKQAFFNSNSVKAITEEELKKLQRIELIMIKDFVTVANNHNLSYTLGGGSVLGAIRHNGFIPWDDDIDINMPRKDFNSFLEIFEDELGDKYELSAPELGKNHGMSSVQVKKKGTIYKSFNELSKDSVGICYDIFVSENAPNNKLLRMAHGMLCLSFGYLLTCRKTWHDLPFLTFYIEKNHILKKAFNKKAQVGRLFAWIPLDTVGYWTIKIYSLCKNNQSKFVTFPSGRKHYFGELGLREDLQKSEMVPFEDILLPVPTGAEDYLQRLYGENYMDIPSEENREQHPLMQLDFGDFESK